MKAGLIWDRMGRLGWTVLGWAGLDGLAGLTGRPRRTESLHGPWGAHVQVAGLAVDGSTGLVGWMECPILERIGNFFVIKTKFHMGNTEANSTRKYLGTTPDYNLGWPCYRLYCNPNINTY